MEIKSFKHLNIDSETVRSLVRNYINELMNNDADIENGLASMQRQIDTYLRK